MKTFAEIVAEIELKTIKTQKEILSECLENFNQQDDKFWIFVHVRNIAFEKEGRKTEFGCNVETEQFEEDSIKKSLQNQHKIDKFLRTYNELIVCEEDSTCHDNLGGCFSFGDDADGGIHFTNEQIKNAIGDFSLISSVEDENLNSLQLYRLSIAINEKIRETFNIKLLDKKNLSLSVAEEIRYSIQILMLWSKTMNWKYIETHHSKNSFDSLSSLVITVCSSDRKLESEETKKIYSIIKSYESCLSELMRDKKERATPRGEKGEKMLDHRCQLAVELTVKAPGKSIDLWNGCDVFATLDYVRRLLFSATYEGVPESYSLIFGHPGFIARPYHLSECTLRPLSSIRSDREISAGLLDRLNIIDIFGTGASSYLDLHFTTMDFPPRAKRLLDFQQAYELSLERLSLFHDEMIVVGIICKEVVMVYKNGVLICIFNGSWKRIQTWQNTAEQLFPKEGNIGLPEHIKLQEIYKILTRLAYGSAPRSVIVLYSINPCDDEFPLSSEVMQPFKEKFKVWQNLSSNDLNNLFEENLMRASKTDGAIVIWHDLQGNLHMISQARIILGNKPSIPSSGASVTSAASGTGDATAKAIAELEKGWTTMKVSQDGGLKVRHNTSLVHVEENISD